MIFVLTVSLPHNAMVLILLVDISNILRARIWLKLCRSRCNWYSVSSDINKLSSNSNTVLPDFIINSYLTFYKKRFFTISLHHQRAGDSISNPVEHPGL